MFKISGWARQPFSYWIHLIIWFLLFHCNWKAVGLFWAAHTFSVLLYYHTCHCRILEEFKLWRFLFCRVCRWVKQGLIYYKKGGIWKLLFSRVAVFLEGWYWVWVIIRGSSRKVFFKFYQARTCLMIFEFCELGELMDVRTKQITKPVQNKIQACMCGFFFSE